MVIQTFRHGQQVLNASFLLQEIYPGQFQPSPCHRFISMLDKQGKLLRNYTQNIDTLEQVAGVQRIIQCHGKCYSLIDGSCLICGKMSLISFFF